jgi:hypothetical protein
MDWKPQLRTGAPVEMVLRAVVLHETVGLPEEALQP